MPGALLLGGTGILALAAAFHPLPVGDATERLATINVTSHWGAVHWSLLAAQVLVLAGYMALAAWLSETGQAGLLRPGAGAVILGVTFISFNILFMTGAGPGLAALQAQGNPSAAQLFDALHPWGLAAQRLGGGALGLGVVFYGVAALRSGRVPAGLARAGVAAGSLWLLLAIFFDAESAPFLAGFALAGAWQAALGVWLVTKGLRRNALPSP